MRSVLHRLCFLFLSVMGLAAVHGQDDGPIKMTPELAFTFPLVLVNKSVTVKYPVLVNPSTVIKPGMVLRTLYILSTQVDDSSNMTLAHKGSMEQAFSRSVMTPEEKAQMPTALSNEMNHFRKVEWPVVINFQLALAQLPTERAHLLYVPDGDNRDITDTRLSFFDGMFVGLPEGKVTVLAVEINSKADHAGVKAGDEVISVSGVPIKGDLMNFSTAYASAKKIAKDNNATSFDMVLVGDGKSDTHTVAIGMPPTIKSSLMDGF